MVTVANKKPWCGAAPAPTPLSPVFYSPSSCSSGSRIAPSRARRHKKKRRGRSGGAVVAPTRGSSIYRGVCRNIGSGKYEAHLWDGHRRSTAHERKGGQGSYDTEEAAARTYDLAALKYWGSDCGILNFPVETYDQERERMQRVTRKEYLAQLRRNSCGFARGASKYRGVSRQSPERPIPVPENTRTQINGVAADRFFTGEDQVSEGVAVLVAFPPAATEEEAARAYDLAAIQLRGFGAVTNFDVDCYMDPGQVMAARPGPPLAPLLLQPKDEPESAAPPAPVLRDDVDRAVAEVLEALCVDPADFNARYNLPRHRCWPSSDDDVRDLPRDVGFEDDIESVLFGDAPGTAAAQANMAAISCAAATISWSASVASHV
ncbi:hypothetical protein ACQ4PT_007455 [Festuca glaucescens]